jgi:hypothetical protein
MKMYSIIPTAVFESEFLIKRLGVSKMGDTRFGVPWEAMLKDDDLKRSDAFELAKRKASQLGGFMRLIKGEHLCEFKRESVFALRISVIKNRYHE